MADDTVFVKEAMPTLGGTLRAWSPEYQATPTERTPDGWFEVPITRDSKGIPGAGFAIGISATMGLCSYAQAQALAWSFSADMEARTNKPCAVRVVEYSVVYDIKCYREQEPRP